MTPLDRAAARLSAAGIEEPRKEARRLLQYVLGVGAEILIGGTPPLSAAELTAFDAVIERRAAREPFAYITGRREFWSLDFAVEQGVLIPRPESETLIEAALKVFPDRSAPLRVLDLGLGTGCLLLAFLSEFPDAHGLGMEASPVAAAIARRNVGQLGLNTRADVVNAGWGDAPSGPFDAIFSNPPYIAETERGALASEVRLYEPEAALFAGADGLDAYRSLMPVIASRLGVTGRAFVEIGQGQAERVQAIAAHAGLEILTIVPDLANIPRCLVVSAR